VISGNGKKFQEIGRMKRAVLVLLVAGAWFVGNAPLAVAQPTVIATIRLGWGGHGPVSLAVNPTTNRIYVANEFSNNVSVIDGGSNTVVATVPVGSGPVGVAVNSGTNRIYVANTGDDTMSVIEDVPVTPPPTSTPGPSGTTEGVPLQGGACIPVATTYPDNTPIATIAAAVAPSSLLEGLWEFDGVTWLAYSPQFPQASNLTHMNRLDVVFICIGGSGPGAATFTRPVI
jgi:YVTN family beta-propeller protein